MQRPVTSAVNAISMKLFLLFLTLMLSACDSTVPVQPDWPAVTRESKPWSRWWWHGSALTKEGITAEMEAYKAAGLGGLEITPIYGVVGYEDRFVNYLSPQWMELLDHTLKEAERLDMGIDMATGTGWPFGGPWVGDEDACKNLNYTTYEVKGGARLREKIQFAQRPYLEAIGMLYSGTGKLPSGYVNAKKLNIAEIRQPVSANTNLQALAIDQVQFERPLPLQTLMAYSDSGKVLDLTEKVDPQGMLQWEAPTGGHWKLYAVFAGWHGKMVERAGPGGEGNVIDHFSAGALKNYLSHFDSAFQSHNLRSLRAFFNDSYEVDDARGAADWTPALFDAFRENRGYDLREHLPALFGHDEEEKNRRVLCDYRETISELLLQNFTQPWKAWAHGYSALVRNQAHGSPSNILDLYAAVDIPEIEGVEPLRIRMASSAGNVTGKKFVSAESATWLNEHFESNLGDIKLALDRFMLHGVNHLFYHGTSYSPPGEPWPGWLFYAAVHLNPRNPLWNDFDTLNQYVTRCQSFLQRSSPDNDVLLYYPVYDRFSSPGREMIEHFDGVGKPFEHTAFRYAAEKMLAGGYAFDYISDKQTQQVRVRDGRLMTEGESVYQTIVLPRCDFIPLGTLKKIVSLAEEGATVIALQGLPRTVCGYGNLEQRQREFDQIIGMLNKRGANGKGIVEVKIGKGTVLMGDSLDVLLSHAVVRRESMVDEGVQYIRKKEDSDRVVYFIANGKKLPFEGWLPLSTKAGSVVLYDPMDGRTGKGDVRNGEDGRIEVFVQLTPGQTLMLETYPESIESHSFHYRKVSGDPVVLSGTWTITFTSGGPELPESVDTDSLASWTAFKGEAYQSFSGMATYRLSFAKPERAATGWVLDLGSVNESADVSLNGVPLGTLIGPTYQVDVDPSLLKESNVLEVKVSNLMANRIAAMDRKKIPWKKFYNVNFPSRKPENRVNGLFDASQWLPEPSGLLGPVRLIPTGQQ